MWLFLQPLLRGGTETAASLP